MDWSYIAGFFDGEGNFHMVFTKKSIQIVCRMFGDSIKVFEEMIKFMGFGTIYRRKKEEHVPELTITKKEYVKTFLENILPYLILKKEHAEFILSNYNFNRHNNLDFDRETFYSFIKRKNVQKFRKDWSKEIKERKNHLLR